MAPFAISASTISVWLNSIAQCRGVWPLLSVSLTSAPNAINILVNVRLPLLAANLRAAPIIHRYANEIVNIDAAVTVIGRIAKGIMLSDTDNATIDRVSKAIYKTDLTRIFFSIKIILL